MSSGILSKQNRVLLYELVKTDFKLRYQGSFLGILWSVLKPLLLFAVMYTVFVHFLRFTDGTATYPIILLLGISLWTFFTEATNVGMQSIVGRGDILRKISFPNMIIIISSMLSASIGLLINITVVLMIALITGVKFTPLALFVPLNILQLFAIAFGLALLLSSLYVKFRDIGPIWEVVMQILFYSMPIIYPLAQVGDRQVFGVYVRELILMNPIAQSIQDVRHNLVAPETTPTTWEVVSGAASLLPIVITVIILAIGIWYFNKNSKKFAEIL